MFDTTIGMVLVQIDDHHIAHVIYYLNKGLVGIDLRYSYIEKLELVVAYVFQCFRHYTIHQTTMVASKLNPMQYIVSFQILGSMYSKWIVILQEFNLEFTTTKSKKSLVFAELMVGLPRVIEEFLDLDSLPNESLFLIESSNLWYGDIIIYLQAQRFHPDASKDDH